MKGDASPEAARQARATLSDPSVMRALAHPVRLAILQRLQAAGPATASELAEVVTRRPPRAAPTCAPWLRPG